MNEATTRVVIGMDPHKRSVTIEIMTSDESILGKGRFGTDHEGHDAMRRHVKAWPNRVWAIEGCQGSVDTSPTGFWPKARPCSMFHPSCPPEHGSSRPDRAERPTPLMPTRSRWSGPG